MPVMFSVSSGEIADPSLSLFVARLDDSKSFIY